MYFTSLQVDTTEYMAILTNAREEDHYSRSEGRHARSEGRHAHSEATAEQFDITTEGDILYVLKNKAGTEFCLHDQVFDIM